MTLVDAQQQKIISDFRNRPQQPWAVRNVTAAQSGTFRIVDGHTGVATVQDVALKDKQMKSAKAEV